MVAALRSGRVSAVELTAAVLERIDAVDGQVNAMASVRRDAALRDAAAADSQRTPRGPLHGLPVTVKDAFHVAGLPTTWGNPAWADAVADTDATVVRRLLNAGAILVGTTNVALMLGDFGQTRTRYTAAPAIPTTCPEVSEAPRAGRPPRWPPA